MVGARCQVLRGVVGARCQVLRGELVYLVTESVMGAILDARTIHTDPVLVHVVQDREPPRRYHGGRCTLPGPPR